MKKKWPAPAKINLFLYITGNRINDGYHIIQTLFQFLDYSDMLTIIPTTDGKIYLKNTITGIKEQNNLIIRAARLLQSYCWAPNDPMTLGANIYLKKNIPIGGGLGGGSSDAATTLIALNMQWKIKLDLNTLAKLGTMIGADIPVFVHGKASLAEGIGDKLTPICPIEKWYLIAIPPIRISTSKIFNDPELKRNTPKRSVKELMNTTFYNDCEPIIRKNFSMIEKHILWLLKYAPTRLTGTGACVFAEFDKEDDARKVLSKSPKWMKSFIAKGTNTSPLHRLLSKI